MDGTHPDIMHFKKVQIQGHIFTHWTTDTDSNPAASSSNAANGSSAKEGFYFCYNQRNSEYDSLYQKQTIDGSV